MCLVGPCAGKESKAGGGYLKSCIFMPVYSRKRMDVIRLREQKELPGFNLILK